MDYSSNTSSVLRLILCRSTVSLDFVSDLNIIACFSRYGKNQKPVIAYFLINSIAKNSKVFYSKKEGLTPPF